MPTLQAGREVGQFASPCPINFSLSRRYDKLKLIGHQTDPLRAGREVSFPVSIKWNQQRRVSRYRLQVAADEKFQNIFLDARVYGNRYTASELAPGYYYWRVAAADSGLGAFSTPVRFFVSGGVVSTAKLPERSRRRAGVRWKG